MYFAVDSYSELELILANGYLSYTFFAYYVATQLDEYNEYCNLCWNNLVDAFSRLPLMLPASMHAIAALALGVSTKPALQIAIVWTLRLRLATDL